jgi:hypothetical protein
MELQQNKGTTLLHDQLLPLHEAPLSAITRSVLAYNPTTAAAATTRVLATGI